MRGAARTRGPAAAQAAPPHAFCGGRALHGCHNKKTHSDRRRLLWRILNRGIPIEIKNACLFSNMRRRRRPPASSQSSSSIPFLFLFMPLPMSFLWEGQNLVSKQISNRYPREQHTLAKKSMIPDRKITIPTGKADFPIGKAYCSIGKVHFTYGKAYISIEELCVSYRKNVLSQ